MKKLKSSGPPNMVKLLVGNKCDLINERQVEQEEASEFAKQHGMAHIETSALESTNVNTAFNMIID